MANSKSIGLYDGANSENEGTTDREVNAFTNASMVRGTGALANAGGEGLQRLEQHGTPHTGQQQSEPSEPCGSAGKCGETVADAYSFGHMEGKSPIDATERNNAQLRFTERCETVPHSKSTEREAETEADRPASGVRIAVSGWWTVEPDVGRVAHGVPNRVDRIKCLGNAVVPQQFYPFFRAIAEIEKGGNLDSMEGPAADAGGDRGAGL